MEVWNKSRVIVALGTLVCSYSLHAQSGLELGQIQASAGCGLKVSKVALKSSEIQVPIKLSVELNSDGGAAAVARKSCVVSIPLDVPSTHGVQIESLQVDQSQKLTVGTGSDLQVEVFRPGTQSVPLKISNQAVSKALISKSKVQQKVSVLFGCGESGTLRVNSSALLKADESESASAARLSYLKLRYKLIPCAN